MTIHFEDIRHAVGTRMLELALRIIPAADRHSVILKRYGESLREQPSIKAFKPYLEAMRDDA